MKKDAKQRLFEVMSRVDDSFTLNDKSDYPGDYYYDKNGVKQYMIRTEFNDYVDEAVAALKKYAFLREKQYEEDWNKIPGKPFKAYDINRFLDEIHTEIIPRLERDKEIRDRLQFGKE